MPRKCNPSAKRKHLKNQREMMLRTLRRWFSNTALVVLGQGIDGAVDTAGQRLPHGRGSD